jgi:hypothetical protein
MHTPAIAAAATVLGSGTAAVTSLIHVSRAVVEVEKAKAGESAAVGVS